MYITVLEILNCMSFGYLNLCSYECTLIFSLGTCRVDFKLKSDTNLFEIAKCKTSVSAIEVLQLYEHTSRLIVDNSILHYLDGL